MYNDQNLPKIYSISTNQIEIESQESSFQAEWCPKVRKLWSKSVQADYKNLGSEVQAELNEVAAVPFSGYPKTAEKKLFDRLMSAGINVNNEGHLQDADPPESLPAYQAIAWTENHRGVDMRPHLQDPVLGQLLVDSGSQVTAFPPEPGDKEVEGQLLKAVNGSKIKCIKAE